MDYIKSFGALPQTKDIRDYVASCAVPREFPESFELEMPEVKNQGMTSTCVAHSIATTIEYHNKKQQENDDKFSIDFIYGNRRNTTYKGNGMYVREALLNYVNFGDVVEDMLPGAHDVPKAIDIFEEKYESLKEVALPNRATQFFALNSDDARKAALMDCGPIVFSIKWFSDYQLKDDVLVRTNLKNYQGGCHCMVIYGWNERGWKVQNSWGSGYASDGRFILPFGTVFDTCYGVTDDIVNVKDIEIEKPCSKLPKFIVKLINFILNLFAKKK